MFYTNKLVQVVLLFRWLEGNDAIIEHLSLLILHNHYHVIDKNDILFSSKTSMLSSVRYPASRIANLVSTFIALSSAIVVSKVETSITRDCLK